VLCLGLHTLDSGIGLINVANVACVAVLLFEAHRSSPTTLSDNAHAAGPQVDFSDPSMGSQNR
jgi:hypothetical protein